jgi:uncharacterized phage-like protein YoqJ
LKTLITGHRVFKLQNYDIPWIKESIELSLQLLNTSYGLSGMASGVDLWFCEICQKLQIPYAACIPFEEQQDLVESDEKELRLNLIKNSSKTYIIRNSIMLERSESGIVVWDGNKGGTHNVVQQLVEHSKPFIWINPVNNKLWECF